MFRSAQVLLLATSILIAGVMVVGESSKAATSPTASTPTGATDAATTGSDLSAMEFVAQNQSSVYVPIAPCRIVDTREGTGDNDDPFNPNEIRTFRVGGTTSFPAQGGRNGGCGIPIIATAIAATIIAVTPGAAGGVRAWPANLGEPTANVLNYGTFTMTGAGTVSLQPGVAASLKVRNYGGPADIAIDVTGYYVKQIYGTFNADGSRYGGNGTLTLFSHSSVGSYTLMAQRDLTGCTPVATAYFTPYAATAYVSGDRVEVNIVNGAGVPASWQFNVVVLC